MNLPKIPVDSESAESKDNENGLLDLVAHDLRAGLVPLKTYSQMLVAGVLGPMNEKQAEALQAIDHCAQRQADKIASVLDMVKASEGRLELQVDTVNLPEILEHALNSCKRDSKRRGITILTDFPPGATLADVDVPRLERVIGVLVTRAIRLSPEKSQIGLELRNLEDGRARIRIWDNGSCKFPQELDVLRKSCKEQAQERIATGAWPDLDMAPVRDIVDAHRGSIRIEAEEGLGATCLIYLPLCAKARKKESAADDANRAKAGHVLVAHDDELEAKAIHDHILGLGHAVTLVKSGKLAIHAARRQHFPIVILGHVADGLDSARLVTAIASQRPEDPQSFSILQKDAEALTANTGRFKVHRLAALSDIPGVEAAIKEMARETQPSS